MCPVDLEASREKGEVSLRWDERGASCDTAAQAAEEEGQQNGLDNDGLRTQRTLFTPRCFDPPAPSYFCLTHSLSRSPVGFFYSLMRPVR